MAPSSKLAPVTSAPTNSQPPAERSQPKPIEYGAVLLFTFINSIGTGVVTNGIFFLTDGPSYGFSQTQNYLLGIVQGITYIAAAVLAGRALARLGRKFPAMTSRGVLVALMLAMAALTTLPQLAAWMAGPGQRPGAWAIWLLVCLYSPLTGVLWPITESYVSGGRSGQALRSAIGVWNVVWSAAIVVAFCGISPLIKSHATEAILALGGLHLLVIPVVMMLARNPAPHGSEHHDPHPPVYDKLLVTFRMLLPMSYVVSSVLGPYLPGAMARLGVAADWRASLATAWLVPRVLMFFVLQRWQGWHGRWSMAPIGGGLLVGGFGVSVLAPVLASGNVAVALLLAGLCLFGMGMATIYSAALYYAMEVGKAEVDAGGMHEALIGFGFTLGPGIGLAASAAAEFGLLPATAFEPVVFGTVALLALGVTGAVVRRTRRYSATSGESR